MASAPPRTSHPHLLPFPQLSALHLAVTLVHHAPGARRLIRLDSCGACGKNSQVPIFQKIHLRSRFGTETLRHGHPRGPWTFCRSLGFVQGHGCRACELRWPVNRQDVQILSSDSTRDTWRRVFFTWEFHAV